MQVQWKNVSIKIAAVEVGWIKDNRNTWFYSPVDCVSKWSQALKQGVSNSIGLEKLHTASTTAGESEKPNFLILCVALITVFLITAWGEL